MTDVDAGRDDEVEGLAAAVEARRKELGLRPGEFAKAAALTGEGLRAVRNGKRRAYNDRTIFGVARALRWAPDWYERILAGLAPRIIDDEAPPPIDEIHDRLNRIEAELLQQRDVLDRIEQALRGRE